MNQENKLCSRCGTPSVITDAFCKRCGQKFTRQPIASPTQTPSSQPHQVPTPPHQVSTSKSPSKKRMARPWVLAILIFMLFNCVRGYVRYRQDQAQQERQKAAFEQMSQAASVASQYEQGVPTPEPITPINQPHAVTINIASLVSANPATVATLLGEPIKRGTTRDAQTGKTNTAIKYELPNSAPGSCFIVFENERATRFGVNLPHLLTPEEALSSVGLDTNVLEVSVDNEGTRFWHGTVEGVTYDRITVVHGDSSSEGTLVAVIGHRD